MFCSSLRKCTAFEVLLWYNDDSRSERKLSSLGTVATYVLMCPENY